MSGVEFTVPGDPVPWERARTNGRAHFTPKRTRAHEQLVKGHALRAGVRPTHLPVRLTVRCYRATLRRCDVDNLAKSVQDALNGVAYLDDSQIVELVAAKDLDRDNPRTEVRIEALA